MTERQGGDGDGFEGTRLSNSPPCGPIGAMRKVLRRYRETRR
ncbi:hypothetical protein [Haloarcula montana]|nr:hypothetical protein [Haloarcula sp. GH36]